MISLTPRPPLPPSGRGGEGGNQVPSPIRWERGFRGEGRWEWVALALILLVAASLRLGAPGITEFKRDEGNLAQLALDMAHGRNLPLLGLSSSVNVPNPPISVYLFAVPFVFSDSPIPATLFVGALNVVAVGLAWALARRKLPRRPRSRSASST